MYDEFKHSPPMSKTTTIITFGILVALLPWGGFPERVSDILFAILGIAIALAAYVSRSLNCGYCGRAYADRRQENVPHAADLKAREERDHSMARDMSGISIEKHL